MGKKKKKRGKVNKMANKIKLEVKRTKWGKKEIKLTKWQIR